MKLTYPRAIALVQSEMVDLNGLITHRFSLEQAGQAFDLVAGYADGVIKAAVHP